ncbi:MULTISPECIES: 3-hydroxyacyl-ACP dehydratase FabZ [Helicobacter]|uniref:3-hydroxyacyl-[acyl-carrier-protein] dehydratase FabZ n=1 Tax=Helicobacter ibis TaxID=2962633 RepID=A0ABT4VD54_9HELI|nr:MULTISPECIES: 3-hydroxyacyl-ACP dehydratase FabZ [Helicobacter]MDA3966850.1 3-hydroxyacyl-ACP dehydratase FabZ [Helicobacter sp. WB40]MDA3968080.1 3-hydroxyacyl-ACP dehydratase FabZ [Helicobacter ibis]
MIDIQKIKDILPHRYPLLLVDRIVDIKVNESLSAYKNVTINEDIFNGHFPGQAVYPGVYIIEGMAQAGGVLAFISMFGEDSANNGDKIVYFMSIDNAKFRKPVVPGDRLDYKLEVLKHKGDIWVLQGYCYVDDKMVAQAELKAMIVDKKAER